MTRVVGMIALKGGVGKTACTASLGSALAYTFNQKVLLLDANFSAPNLGFYFNIINPEKTIHDVLCKKTSIENVIYEYDKNLHIIPAALVAHKIKNVCALKYEIQKIKDNYDVVVIDSSPHLGPEIFATIHASQQVHLITTPDIPSLSTTLRLLKIVRQNGRASSQLVINKVKREKYELQRAEIEHTADADIGCIIPYDKKVEVALSVPKPLHKLYPKTKAAIAFNSLAASITGEDYSDPRFLSKLKRLFSKK